MGRLLLLFVVLPAVELALLIEVGGRIGTLNTLALIVVTGVLGASLARRQGLDVLRQMQGEIAEGRLPAGSLIDGVIILLAAALLVTPGILTDAVGLLCLVPGFRSLVKGVLWRRLERAVRENRVQLQVHFEQGREGGGERTVYDVGEDGGRDGGRS
jgi:UPF0716 protein FxsA